MFGGTDGKVNLRSCEKMDLSDKRWTDIWSMTHARGSFTPCHFRSLLYLVSCWREGGRSPPVETFNPVTEAFTVLPITLPPQLTLSGRSVSFVANEELCVLTYEKQMARWKVDTEREFRLSDTGEVMWSLQQPVIVGSLLLIACEGGVKQFSLETYTYVKFIE